jgi:HD-GYP domain-containing protein (c-di-GMP phosphodiesterase class II)
MMSVADIYDALTASDRPYKKAVPHDNAVRILQEEVERGALDGDLVRLFTNDEVPRRVIGEVEFDRVNTGKISGVF